MKIKALFLMLSLAFACVAFAGNVTTSNPMLIDTAGVISTTPLYITEIIWDQVGTDGDVVIIKDNASGYQKAYRQGIQGVPMTI